MYLPCQFSPLRVSSVGMGVGKELIACNLRRIRQEIEAACDRCGRSPAEVTLVAVTKSGDLQDIRDLVELGVCDLAESRPQQLIQRVRELEGCPGGPPAAAPVRWHMVGHLQRNKVRHVLEVSRIIHSVDSLRLAEDINTRCDRMGIRADIMIEVNCSNEPQKHGCAVAAAAHLAEQVCTLPQVRLVGLMTMASLGEQAEQARAAFARLREIFDEMRHHHVGDAHLAHLSMGMSGDFGVAIEEGATMVRIGTALFERS